jgi:hypothetical protein
MTMQAQASIHASSMPVFFAGIISGHGKIRSMSAMRQEFLTSLAVY